MTRRDFIGGAAALGAFGGLRAFGAKAGTTSGRPNLRVGLISDLHIQVNAATGKVVGFSDDRTFLHALEYFRDIEVDAVVIPGDLTDYGKISEMELVAKDWFSVFPDDRLPNGRKVERLFTFGNHDWDYFCKDPKWALSRYGAEKEEDVLKLILHGDPKGIWERLWHEPFEHYFTREIRGYRFFAAHWMDGKSTMECFGGAKDFLERNKALIDPKRPFFYVQHAPPQGTVFPWTQVSDYGALGPALKPHPNAIALVGHSHLSVADERSIWQDEYTVVNAGCLRWTDAPNYSRKPFGYENSRSPVDRAKNDPVKMMRLGWADWEARQGLVMEVFDDRVVFRRRDFLHDLSLGDDWVVPTGPERPYSFARRTKEMAAPQFAKGAKLVVTRGKAKTRGIDPNVVGPDCVEKDCLSVTIPQAHAIRGVRPAEYDIEIRTAAKTEHSRYVLDVGYGHSLDYRPRQREVTCPVAVENLPQGGEFRFVVTPIGFFGRKGRSLVSQSFKLTDVS